jgi:hypothetical protein
MAVQRGDSNRKPVNRVLLWRVAAVRAYVRGMAQARRHVRGRPSTAVPLSGVLAQLPGKFVAVDRETNEPVAAADSPYALAAEIRSKGLRNVTVVRAPDPSEPELVGLG